MKKAAVKIGTKGKVKKEALAQKEGLTVTDKLEIRVTELEVKLMALEKFVAEMYANSNRVIKQDETSKEEPGIRYGN
jgi:hypothetical protein